jgi:predicted Rossmann-fold nucleotide-binding protein
MFGLIAESDLFVVFRGGSGTISEFGTIWVLANIYYGHHKPFILYGGFWWEIVDVLYKNMSIDDQEMDCFRIVESPEAVLEAIKHFEWKMGQLITAL